MNAASGIPSLSDVLGRHTRALVLAACILVPGAGEATAQSSSAEAAALMSAGAEAIESGQFDKATADFSNALDSGGLNAEGRALAHYHRAISYQKTGQQDAAITDYSRAISGSALPAPVQARAHYNRGIALANAGDLAGAEADYREAIALAPNYAAVYHNLANLERRQQRYAAAVENYSSAIRLMTGNDRKLPLFGRALAHEQLGNMIDSEADLRRALAVDPEFEVASVKLDELSTLETAKPAAVQTAKSAEPRVLPAMLTPFQSASSGNEGGAVIRMAKSGGWETTAVRFGADGRIAEAATAATVLNESEPAEPLITASIRPSVPVPHVGEAAALQAPSTKAQYRIQLGAFRDEETAVREWGKISRSADAVVSGYEHFVQRADLGERGIFYRLRAGAFDGVGQARAACKALEARKIACIVVDS